MCRKIWMVCVMTIILFSARGTESQVMENEISERVDYRLVREQMFKEPIVDVAFGVSLGKAQKIYPKVVVKEEEVEFYDGDFNLVSTHKCLPNWFGVTFSKNANYIVVSTSTVLPTKETVGKRRLEILNDKGKKIWEKEVAWEYDQCVPEVFISDKGSMVESDYERGILNFYDRSGNLIRKVKPFGDVEIDNGRDFKCSFSDDGRYFAMVACEHGPRLRAKIPSETTHPKTQKEIEHLRKEIAYLRATKGVRTNPWVILFDNSGKELWRHPLNDDYGGEVAISPHGKYIIASHYNFRGVPGERPVLTAKTILFKDDGTVIEEYNLLAYPIAFSPNDNYVAFSGKHQQKKWFGLVDCKTGNLLWEHKGLVSDMSVSSNGAVLIKRGSELILYGVNGKPVWQKSFPQGEEIGKRKRSTIIVTPDGANITAAFKKQFLYYKVR